MQEEIINDDLLVKGNVICGEDGILEAEGDIIWGCAFVDDEPRAAQVRELFKDVQEGDFNLEGRKVLVHGKVRIWGEIITPDNWNGHMSII